MDSCSPFSNSDYSLGLSKTEVHKLFRTGNKLMAKAVNAVTCPLGDINRSIRKFESWTEDQHYSIADYFERTFMAEAQIAATNYYRPVTRGRDGMLYSASDMDHAMMNC